MRQLYTVLVTFQHPAYDERAGIRYETHARSKAEANRNVRRIAHDDGHTVGRRAYFTATLVEDGE